MLRILTDINFVIFVLMSAAYFYHFVYMAVGFAGRHKVDTTPASRKHRFAALICARNETAVIGELVESLKNQNYPSELLDIYVLADNCTDDTASAAERAGARVFIRYNSEKVGKGYALDYLLKKIKAECGYRAYDGYFVFDADNIVDRNFVSEMNRTYSKGYDVITCYRNSKNFASNWITYGYSLWFLYEARYINAARMALNNGCAVSGTGFMVSSRIIEENNGWPFHLLTEDIQFSVNCAVNGCKIGYCNGAIVYDEQPQTFSQSWAQRMRWAKGFYQIDTRYLGKLVRGMFINRGVRMTCYDIFMTVAPLMLFSVMIMGVNFLVLGACLLTPAMSAAYSMAAITARLIAADTISFIITSLLFGYVGVVLMGLMTVISEWNRIPAEGIHKIALLPTFPVFLATYVPIAIIALFVKVDWKPIRHFSSSEIRERDALPVGRRS
ncbi:MAG: glycosyltransferase family 2 protein [Oscillospiraceae bacterium]|nr:glycosyltransferase family 2 protein [Oscillospiraceae bacterium]